MITVKQHRVAGRSGDLTGPCPQPMTQSEKSGDPAKRLLVLLYGKGHIPFRPVNESGYDLFAFTGSTVRRRHEEKAI